MDKDEDANDVFKFFPDCNNDGLNLRWGHAVNSWPELIDILSSENSTRVHMIEGDVIIRRDPSSLADEDVPVMGHPPATDGNLTFHDWLKSINEFRGENSKGEVLRVGAKADFKSLPAARAAMKIVKGYRDILSAPLWLNADIVVGPNGGGPASPVNADEFLGSCASDGPGLTLSLGWTTPPAVDAIRCGRGYGWVEILDMYRKISPFIRASAASDLPRITFAVRAALVRPSGSRLLWLLDTCAAAAGGREYRDKLSITLWTAKADNLAKEDYAALNALRSKAGKNRVFIDLPDADVKCVRELPAETDELQFDKNQWKFTDDDDQRVVAGRYGVAFLSGTNTRMVSTGEFLSADLHGRFVFIPRADQSVNQGTNRESILISVIDQLNGQVHPVVEFSALRCASQEEKPICVHLKRNQEKYKFSLTVNLNLIKINWQLDDDSSVMGTLPNVPGCDTPLNCTAVPHATPGQDHGNLELALDSKLTRFKFSLEQFGSGDFILDHLAVSQ